VREVAGEPALAQAAEPPAAANGGKGPAPEAKTP
jgi:hypothetical protein